MTGPEHRPEGVHRLKCGDIGELLPEYLSHELGESRSALVREHLRLCDNCRQAAADMQSTLDILGQAGRAEHIPDKLTGAHRERLVWALAHPLMNWVDRHHREVALCIMVVALLLAGWWVAKARLFKDYYYNQWYEIEIGVGVAPTLVGDERQVLQDSGRGDGRTP